MLKQHLTRTFSLEADPEVAVPELPSPAVPQDAARPLPLVRLSDLEAGQTARLHCAALSAQDCALLRAIGLTDRCVLRICKVGEPCIVQVRATRIGLSRIVADGIMVVPQEHT